MLAVGFHPCRLVQMTELVEMQPMAIGVIGVDGLSASSLGAVNRINTPISRMGSVRVTMLFCYSKDRLEYFRRGWVAVLSSLLQHSKRRPQTKLLLLMFCSFSVFMGGSTVELKTNENSIQHLLQHSHHHCWLLTTRTREKLLLMKYHNFLLAPWWLATWYPSTSTLVSCQNRYRGGHAVSMV